MSRLLLSLLLSACATTKVEKKCPEVPPLPPAVREPRPAPEPCSRATNETLHANAFALAMELARARPAAVLLGEARVRYLEEGTAMGWGGFSTGLVHVFVCAEAPITLARASTRDVRPAAAWARAAVKANGCVTDSFVLGPEADATGTFTGHGCAFVITAEEEVPSLVTAQAAARARLERQSLEATCGKAATTACLAKGCLMGVEQGCPGGVAPRESDPPRAPGCKCDCRNPRVPEPPCLPRP